MVNPNILIKTQKVLKKSFNPHSLTMFLKENLEKDLSDYAGNVNFKVQIIGLVNGANEEGWFEKLIDEAIEARPGEQEFKDIKEMLGYGRTIKPQSEYDAVFLKRNHPFFNRKNLREVVKEFVHNPRSRVLVVNGEPKSGKSYSRWYFSHLQDEKCFKLEWFDFTRFEEPKITWELIAQELDQRLGLNHFNSNKKNNSKVSAFCNIFAQKVANSDKHLVILFDKCNRVEFQENVHDFIGKLAEDLEMQSQNTFLVLSGYNHSLPIDIDGKVYFDKTCKPDERNLNKYLNEYFTSILNGKINTDEERVRVANENTKKILKKISDTSNLSNLSNELREATLDILRD